MSFVYPHPLFIAYSFISFLLITLIINHGKLIVQFFSNKNLIVQFFEEYLLDIGALIKLNILQFLKIIFSSKFISFVFYQTLIWYQMKYTSHIYHHYLLFVVLSMMSFTSSHPLFLTYSFIFLSYRSSKKNQGFLFLKVLYFLKFLHLSRIFIRPIFKPVTSIWDFIISIPTLRWGLRNTFDIFSL